MIRPHEIVVDNFAGGGGASTGIEAALGRSVDIAVNHDEAAVAMHTVNHPRTKHLRQNIWQVDPVEACAGKPVGLAWFSPDCKHFSKAKGGKPVERNIRDLAWTVVLWGKRVKSRIIMLENVEEFRDWGPLLTTEDGKLIPDPAQKGLTFRRWVRELRKLGYRVEWRELRACDYGAPTIRKRLYVIARRDKEPVIWPAPSHGPGRAHPYRTAAECIDWSIPCPSIFDRKKPLAEATLRRIARGIMRYVVEAKRPFIVPVTHTGADRVHGIDDPLRTITTAQRGEFGLIVPTIAGVGGRMGQSPERPADKPFQTVMAKGDAALVAAHITKFRSGATGSAGDEPMPTVTANSFVKRPGGAPPLGLVSAHISRQFGNSTGHGADEPLGTVTAGGSGKSALVSAFLAQHNGGPRNENLAGRPADEPISTILRSGSHQGLVAATVSQQYGSGGGRGDLDHPIQAVTAQGSHAALVYAFLVKYYGSTADGQPIDEALHSITSRARFGVVTVDVDGETYVIDDIGMRMLQPRELFNAQGFPPDYRIDADADGNPFTKTEQIRLCGNSVCPPVAEALVRANFGVMPAVGDDAVVVA